MANALDRRAVSGRHARRRSADNGRHRSYDYGALVILDTLDIDVSTFERGTGWTIKPEGACKGDVCVPLPGGFSLEATAERLGMAIVTDEATGLTALGPESIGGRALVSAEAPELVLADLAGAEFRLSSLRGQKVVLVAWAPY